MKCAGRNRCGCSDRTGALPQRPGQRSTRRTSQIGNGRRSFQYKRCQRVIPSKNFPGRNDRPSRSRFFFRMTQRELHRHRSSQPLDLARNNWHGQSTPSIIARVTASVSTPGRGASAMTNTLRRLRCANSRTFRLKMMNATGVVSALTIGQCHSVPDFLPIRGLSRAHVAVHGAQCRQEQDRL